jgi:putative transposase
VKEAKVNKASHCAWQIHYHIVMAVKYRKALIDRRVEVVVEETVRGIGERYEIEMEALGMDKDHVHLLCGAHPKIAPGNIVMKFKSITARELFRRERWLKEELWGGSFWSSGYYVGTVGERANWAIVEKYVLEQGKRKKDLRQLTLW